ncbi:MAG: ThuA domain-containing protein [Microbacterium sp.]|uniref:ThuA domain-containing protein n=1 Tax=Microbacterium sp. TaxID=51671 RepID=UPI0039E4644D
MKAVIAVGTGRYADPWHPYPAIADELATLLAEAGFEVTTEHDVDAAMAQLAGVDLLVVDAGDPWRDNDGASAPGGLDRGALLRATERGTGVLALHSAASSLRDYDGWFELLGGEWVPGISWHPPYGRVDVHTADVPGWEDLRDFAIDDEAYTDLRILDGDTVLAWHDRDGVHHPLVWLRETNGCRVAYDALGHDERSYAPGAHRELVAALARWAGRAE